MKKLLTPLLLALLGLAGGAGAGWMLKPPPPEAGSCLPEGEGRAAEAPGEGPGAVEAPACADEAAEAAYEAKAAASDSDFVEFERQFIVPVVSEDGAGSLMVLTLGLEVEPDGAGAVARREPKLRDALLRALFDHAATGGFAGDFTAAAVMRDLRRNLAAEAKRVAGPAVRDVLVADIVRQDR